MNKPPVVIAKDTVIANLAQCIELLRNCKTTEEAKKLLDTGAAAKLWAERQKLGVDAQNAASEFVLFAKRRLGEILAVTEKHRGGRPGNKPVDNKRQVSTLRALHISRDLSSEAQKLAAVPEEKFVAAIAEAKNQDQEISETRFVRQLTGRIATETPDPKAIIEDAVIVIPAGDQKTDPDMLVAKIRAFADAQLLSVDQQTRITVAHGLQQYASEIIVQSTRSTSPTEKGE